MATYVPVGTFHSKGTDQGHDDVDTRPVVLATISSDAHLWNLVVLQLLLEEHGFPVENLGPCTPVELLVSRCEDIAPKLLALSTVNGHGVIELPALLRRLRRIPQLHAARIVIGGQLTTTGEPAASVVQELLDSGADRVYTAPADLAAFSADLEAVPGHRRCIGRARGRAEVSA